MTGRFRMTGLLELKERLIRFFGKNEIYVVPVLKFILATVVFLLINQNIGYMTRLAGLPVTLVLALLCAVLPVNAILLFAFILIAAHLFALSMDVCVVGLILMLVIALLYLRFSPKDGYYAVLTPITFALHTPYIMPISAGLLRTPASAASIVSGTVMFYFLKGIKENEAVLSAVEEDSNAASKMVVAINQLLGNKEMYLVLATFIVILLVVYVVRRLSIDYAWTVASLAGILIGLTVLISGFVMLGIKGQIVWIIVGGVISTVIALIQQFLFFNLDYSRTERVQFEDDEYYYYVKAVPKMTVAAPTNTVKKINTQRRPANQTAHPAGQGRPSGQSRSGGQNVRSAEGSARSVVTERTAPAGSRAPYGQQNPYRGREMTGGRSVTISSDHMAQGDSDDYEELF